MLELELLERDWEAPSHGRFAGADDLERLRLASPGQRDLLKGYLELLERNEVPPERPPWARPRWLPEVRAWVEREVERLGRRVVALEQVKQWSISSVLRVVTDGPDLYFKVAMRLPLFVEEALLTRRLAERFPGYVPRPLAIEAERGWMLLCAFGEFFQWDAPLPLRRAAFGRFAELQRGSADDVAGLLAAGCLDRRLEVLETQIDPLVQDAVAVANLSDEEIAELERLAPAFKELCRRLSAAGLPATLVHGDLHMGNVTRLDGELVYFDWTDACVAHPFCDLHSLQWVRDEPTRAAILEAYLEPWRGVVSPEALRESVELARVVTPLHHAVSYQHIVAGLEPAVMGELDITHKFLREALAHVRPLVGSP